MITFLMVTATTLFIGVLLVILHTLAQQDDREGRPQD